MLSNAWVENVKWQSEEGLCHFLQWYLQMLNFAKTLNTWPDVYLFGLYKFLFAV